MRLRITLLIFILSAIRLCAGASAASKNDFRVEGYLTNMVTGAPLTESFKVEILMPDSTVIASGNSAYTTHQSTGPRNFYNVSAKGEGDTFILRLSHPDFDTFTRQFSPKSHFYDAGIIEMRRLSKFEKGRTLEEVTVVASIVQFVN